MCEECNNLGMISPVVHCGDCDVLMMLCDCPEGEQLKRLMDENERNGVFDILDGEQK